MDKVKGYIYLVVFILSYVMVTIGYKTYMESKTSTLYVETLESYDNLLEMPDVFINSVAENIVNSYLKEDVTNIQDYTQYFTQEAYDKLINSIEKVRPIGIHSGNGDFTDSRIREINVEKSYSLFSIDIMCNFVVEHPRTSFSGVYLMQMLVNSAGQIYGINIWQY